MVRAVLLDTNMFLLPFQQRIDVFGEIDRLFEGEAYQLQMLDASLKELGKVVLGPPGPENRAARSGADYAKRMVAEGKVAVVKGAKGDVDEAIEAYALKNEAVVATNDFELKKKLREKGLRVITARDGRYLVFA